MRPDHGSFVLFLSALCSVLVLGLDSGSGETECVAGINVRRDTSYTTFTGKELRIGCPVVFCNNPPPTVSWYKLEGYGIPINNSSVTKTDWKIQEPMEGISYLTLLEPVSSDSGVYQCRIPKSNSHVIIVSVIDGSEISNDSGRNETTSRSTETMWTYVYSAAGIGTFVILVIIISVMSMRGCKGKPKKETQSENQYTAIAMAQQPVPHPSPRGSPSVPAAHRSSQRKAGSGESSGATLPNNDVQSSGQKKKRQKNPGAEKEQAEDVGNSVVYAALNHQLRTPRAGARPRRPAEEPSEYAALRVK